MNGTAEVDAERLVLAIVIHPDVDEGDAHIRPRLRAGDAQRSHRVFGGGTDGKARRPRPLPRSERGRDRRIAPDQELDARVDRPIVVDSDGDPAVRRHRRDVLPPEVADVAALAKVHHPEQRRIAGERDARTATSAPAASTAAAPAPVTPTIAYSSRRRPKSEVRPPICGRDGPVAGASATPSPTPAIATTRPGGSASSSSGSGSSRSATGSRTAPMRSSCVRASVNATTWCPLSQSARSAAVSGWCCRRSRPAPARSPSSL